MMVVLLIENVYNIGCAQVESAMAMRSLTPQIKAIQQRYAGDQVRFCLLFLLDMLTVLALFEIIDPNIKSLTSV